MRVPLHVVPFFLAASFSLATNASDLTYQGHVVHPDCLVQLLGGEPTAQVSLAKCSTSIDGVKTDADGFVKYTNPVVDGLRQAYSQYKVVLKQQDAYVLQYEWNGGGTGIFTGLAAVRIDGDQLVKVYSVASGDRCNGGLASVALMQNGSIAVETNLTPMDILDRAPEGRKLGLSAYDDLEDSAASCFATGAYQVDPKTGSATLNGVNLGTTPVSDRAGWTGTIKYQSCFNKVYNDFIARKKTRLDKKGLADFVEAFRTQCLIR